MSRKLFLVANASWFFAFGMQAVVFAWLVTMVLREPAELVGWAQTAILAPGMALILLAGALADKIGADRQAMLAQGFAALAPWILISAIEQGALTYLVMVVYALCMGIAQAFVTPARDGLLNHVAQGQVQRTVLQASLVQFVGQIFGYYLAGFADSVGATPVLVLQSLAMVVGVVAFALVRRLQPAPRSTVQMSVVAGLVDGARTVWASRVMRVVILQNVAMACFFMGSFIVSFPLVVREVFSGSSGDLALLNTFNALGLVVTILVMLRVGYVRFPGRALLTFQMIGSVVLAIAGLVENFMLFVAAVFVWGMCGGIAIPMARTLMQELAPAEQRSRVMSFFAFSFMGAGPLGTILNGYLAAWVGPQLAIVVSGSAMFTVALVISLATRLWHTEYDPAEVPV